MWSLSQWQWPPTAWPDSERRLTRQSGFNPNVTEWRDTWGVQDGFVCVVFRGVWGMGGFGCVLRGTSARSAALGQHHQLVFRVNSVSCAVRLSVTLVYIWASGTWASWQMGAGKLCLVNNITGQRAQILSGSWIELHAVHAEKHNRGWKREIKTDGVYLKGGFEGCRKKSGKWATEEKGTETNVPGYSGVFGLLAYHGNGCLDPSHLGSRHQGLRITEAWSLGWIEKESERSCRENQGMRESGGSYRWCHSWCGVMAKRRPAVTIINQTDCWWLFCQKWPLSLIGVSNVQPLSQHRHAVTQTPWLALGFLSPFFFLYKRTSRNG